MCSEDATSQMWSERCANSCEPDLREHAALPVFMAGFVRCKTDFVSCLQVVESFGGIDGRFGLRWGKATGKSITARTSSHTPWAISAIPCELKLGIATM
jgi:hypothetical protein